jgi:hypothetical protein
MSDTSNPHYRRAIDREIEEANSDWARKQKELDFWWEYNLAQREAQAARRIENPERGDYSPVARLDRELDDAQLEADDAFARRLGYR